MAELTAPEVKRRPKAAYALPTLFTAGNIFLGYLSILRTFQGALLVSSDPSGAASNFETAAKCIGIGMLLDGLDGRIARMTNTTSDFGRELDSLADIISFGIAPALLAFTWGVQFVDAGAPAALVDQLHRAGQFIAFLFLLCGAARLARFNVQKNPVPKNPGRPDRKYFVGLPIPAAAAAVAAVVYFFDSWPVTSWKLSAAWIATLALLGFLMVSTWRYYSFKDINLRSPRSSLIVVILGLLIVLIWNYSQIVLLLLAMAYVMSGIVIRILGILRRLRPSMRKREGSLPEKIPGQTIVIVGTETLLGREVRDVLSATQLGEDLRLVAAEDEGVGKLTEAGGEPSFLIKLTPGSLEKARAIILAGPSDISDDVIELKPAAPLVDLTYAAEEQPQARLRAPMLEPPGLELPKDTIHVVAHPAAIALALVLSRLHVVFPVRRAVIQIFEPASERGSAGIDELQKQTVSLLSFKSMPKDVFDNQLSFSLLARLGDQAAVKLEDVEARIERHLASLLAPSHTPMPSIRLIQAPVFHGHSASLWIELEHNPGVAAIEQALSERFLEVRSRDTEPPNNVGVAGQNEVMVGAIAIDSNQPNAIWLWMALDNLRLTAQNAAMVVRDVA